MALDETLLPVERILQRWVSSVNGGIPDARGMDEHGRPPPLPADLAIYVDRDVQRAPSQIRQVVVLLYRKHLTPEECARRMGISRPKVYAIEREALWYFRGTFHANGILQRFEQRAARLRRQRVQEAERSRVPPQAARGSAKSDAKATNDACEGRLCGASPCACEAVELRVV